MATYDFAGYQEYDVFGNNCVANGSPVVLAGTLDDGDGTDSDFSPGESLLGTGNEFYGFINIGGFDYPVLTGPAGDTTNLLIGVPVGVDPTTFAFPASFDITPDISQSTFPTCFAEGTLIATPDGEKTVETLAIGDPVLTSDGRTVPVRWVGRQTLQKVFAGPRMQPVRIRAGALGDGLPHADLIVTADHGMILDGLVINAAALVNGGTIDWVPLADLPDRVTYHHVETEDHSVIRANGAAAETFIDYRGRRAFDNFQDYLDRYGAERIIPEMSAPRISSQRLLPDAIRARLGIAGDAPRFDELESDPGQISA